MKKIKPVSFSFIVSLAICFLFLLITFWIFYQYSWSAAAAKDALSTTGSYFGAVATLGATIVAAYLFNDWREQEKYKLSSSLALDCLQDYLTAKDKLFFYLFQHKYKTPPITIKELDDFFSETGNKIITLNEILKRINKTPIDQEVVDSFFRNNYSEVIKKFTSTEMLKQYTEEELNDCYLKFINNEKMKLLPGKLLDVLELK